MRWKGDGDDVQNDRFPVWLAKQTWSMLGGRQDLRVGRDNPVISGANARSSLNIC